jgi:DAK2 domain fusion protein YloV
MLTVVRELAHEAEARAQPRLALDGLLDALVSRGEDAVARTPEQLAVLREAGVVDAGGAGLLEIVRGLASAVAGRPLPEAPLEEEPLTVEAIHQELSRYRYCTTFVVEGAALDVERIESELDPLGDSLLVVGDATALKVHVHTDDPGAALRIGTDTGLIDGVEIANMHRQTEAREERLVELVPEVVNETDVVAVTAGAGNRRLFESLGAAAVVEGGQTMNPAASDLVEAIAATRAPQAVVLPNNPNVVLAANQAGDLAPKPVQVVPTESIQAGLAAMVVFDAAADAATNAARMGEAVAGVATGAVTVASRDVQLNGRAIAEGEYLGLVEGEPVTGGGDFAEVARVIVERLLAEPRDVLTLLKGQDQPALDELLDDLRERHPQLELDVQDGGQPHYPLLLSAE